MTEESREKGFLFSFWELVTSLKTSIELVQQNGWLFKSSFKFFYIEFDEKFFDLKASKI